MVDLIVKAFKSIDSNIAQPVDAVIRAEGDFVNGGLGAVPAAVAATCVATEYGNGVLHRTRLVCTAVPISFLDDAGQAQYGGVKLYDFPEGFLLTLGVIVDGALTMPAPFIDAFTGVVAVGSVTASTGTTLTSTEATFLPSLAMTTAVSKVAVCDNIPSPTALTESGARWVNGSATPCDLYLNFAIADDALHTAETGHFTGSVEFVWCILGDK